MPDNTLDDLHSKIESLEIVEGSTVTEQQVKLVEGLRTTLKVLAESIGECRQDVPYSTMRPVRGADGQMKWCCNHETEHCG